MKVLVLSYSYTGNNARFATALSRALDATQVEILPKHAVTTGTIMLDLIFARKPEIGFICATLRGYDLVVLVAPVWMGQPAFPLRRCLEALKGTTVPYAFLTISGGSSEGNPQLRGALIRRTGREPALVHEQFICKLLPPTPAPSRQDVMQYRLTDSASNQLVENAICALKKQFPAIK